MQPYAPPWAFAPPRRERPTGVSAVAILQIILGIALVLGGIAFVALSAEGSSLASSLGDLTAAVFGGMLLVLGLLCFVLALGLWTMRAWARTLSLIGAVVGVLFGVLLLTAFVGVIPLVLGLIIVWYLLRPEIKAAFGARVSVTYGVPGAMAPPPPPPPEAAALGHHCGRCGQALPPGAWACPSCGASA